MTIDKATLDKLCIDAGHVINVNNGQCALIEDFAIKVGSLCLELQKESTGDVWRCPCCHGLGSMCDGSLSIGPEEIKSTPATVCYLCKGKKVVRCSEVLEPPQEGSIPK